MEIFPFLGVQRMHKEYHAVVRAETIPDNYRADYGVYYNSAFEIVGKDEYGAPLSLFYDVWEEMQGDYIADSTTLSSLFIAGAGSSPSTWYAMQLQAYAGTISCRINLGVEMLHFGLSRTEVDTTARDLFGFKAAEQISIEGLCTDMKILESGLVCNDWWTQIHPWKVYIRKSEEAAHSNKLFHKDEHGKDHGIAGQGKRQFELLVEGDRIFDPRAFDEEKIIQVSVDASLSVAFKMDKTEQATRCLLGVSKGVRSFLKFISYPRNSDNLSYFGRIFASSIPRSRHGATISLIADERGILKYGTIVRQQGDAQKIVCSQHFYIAPIFAKVDAREGDAGSPIVQYRLKTLSNGHSFPGSVHVKFATAEAAIMAMELTIPELTGRGVRPDQTEESGAATSIMGGRDWRYILQGIQAPATKSMTTSSETEPANNLYSAEKKLEVQFPLERATLNARQSAAREAYVAARCSLCVLLQFRALGHEIIKLIFCRIFVISALRTRRLLTGRELIGTSSPKPKRPTKPWPDIFYC